MRGRDRIEVVMIAALVVVVAVQVALTLVSLT